MRLSERGLGDGDQLSLITCFAPQGNYAARFDFPYSDREPLGLDGRAWSDIKADFGRDGTFDITMEEMDYDWALMIEKHQLDGMDLYAFGASWDHHYQGTVQMDGSEFRMIIDSVNRRGIFRDEMRLAELRGKLSDGCNQVSICLPFEAGRCRQEVGGLFLGLFRN